MEATSAVSYGESQAQKGNLRRDINNVLQVGVGHNANCVVATDFCRNKRYDQKSEL